MATKSIDTQKNALTEQEQERAYKAKEDAYGLNEAQAWTRAQPWGKTQAWKVRLKVKKKATEAAREAYRKTEKEEWEKLGSQEVQDAQERLKAKMEQTRAEIDAGEAAKAWHIARRALIKANQKMWGLKDNEGV